MAFFDEKNRFIVYTASETKKWWCFKHKKWIYGDECDECRWGEGDPAR
ncbi:MAG: hypothetical protein AAB573_04280 [Patescibacteria group bacterium]